MKPNKSNEKTLNGHSKCVSCLATLGSKIVSGSFDATIKIWDSDEVRLTLEGHEEKIYCLLILCNSIQIVSGSCDWSIKIWDSDEGSCLQTLKGHTNSVSCLLQLSETQIVSGSWDEFIKIWNFNEGTCLKTLFGHSENVSCLLKLNNTQIVSGSWDHSIKIWYIDKNTHLDLINNSNDKCDANCFLELNPTTFISGNGDATIKKWNLEKCLQTLYGHDDSVYCLVKLDSNKIISASSDKSIKTWNFAEGTCLRTLKRTNFVRCFVVLNLTLVLVQNDDKFFEVMELNYLAIK